MARPRLLALLTTGALAAGLALVAAPAAQAVEQVVVHPGLTDSYSETGSWATARAAGFQSTPERFSRDPGATATWTAQAPVAATYDIAVYYAGSVDNAPNTTYGWTGGPDTPTVVDQRSDGGRWRTIGQTYLDEGSELSLTLTAGEGAAATAPSQNVITRANAVRITEVDPDGGPGAETCAPATAPTSAVDVAEQEHGGYTLTQSDTTATITTDAWSLDLERAGFRYALSYDGEQVAAAHPTAGLQLGIEGGAVCDAVTTTITDADETGVTADVLFASGRTATVLLEPSADSVRLAIVADDGRPGTVRAQVAGGLNPAYGLGDLGGFRQDLNVYGVKNLDYYAQHASGTTNQRFISNFTIFPDRHLGQVSLSDERLAIQVDDDATMLGADGVGMEEMHYFFGEPETIYGSYAEARAAAGYVDTKPEYTFFGVGYESYGALGYNTNQATITQSVSDYLAHGYPLQWAVTGSGFWPYGENGTQGTTSSFGIWGEKYPDPDAYKQFFSDNDLALIMGARQSFRALPADGGTYDPARDGDGTRTGIERGYFITDPDGTPRVFTPVSFPNTAMYLIDPDDTEAVAWFAERSKEWGADGYKEDHMFSGTANSYVNNSLVSPINEALDADSLMMVRNSAFSVAGSILRINDTDYNHGGSDRDRTIVNSLAYAASGQPNVYPDIVGGRIITDLETNTAKQRFVTRNAMAAAMLPSMSFGNEPWRMSDPELVAATLKAAQWHGQYQPYIYSAAVDSFESGTPGTVTPMPIAFPDDPATYGMTSYATKTYQWMLGQSLLVAPLYGSDALTATTRDVYLPAGEWQDIETGERFTGPVALEDREQPFGKIPAFVGGTGILVHGTDDGLDEELSASVYPVAQPESEYQFTAPDGETRSVVTTAATFAEGMEAVVTDGSGVVVPHTVDEVTGAVVFPVIPGTDYAVADAGGGGEPEVPADASTAAPAVGVLSSDNGWDTGLHDGDLTVTMNLWWGENASRVDLLQGGEPVASADVTFASPGAQQARFPLEGLANGTYVFTAELVNATGTTTTAPLTVVVRDAAPATPVLGQDNWDGDGAYTVTANLWWGTNATSWSLTEDGVEVAAGELAAATPGAQVVAVPLTGRTPGTRTYEMTFTNAAGSSAGRPVTVTVRE